MLKTLVMARESSSLRNCGLLIGNGAKFLWTLAVNLITKYKKHLEAVLAKEGFAIDY